MKKNYPYKMWSRLSVTSAALLFGASAAQAQIAAVDFGGDYNDANSNASKIVAFENGDFDGEGDGDDRRAYLTIDSLFKSITDTNGVGNTTVINAGVQTTQLDSTAGTPGVGIYRFAGSNTAVDYLQAGNSATIGNGATINDDYPQSLTFAPNVTKANFLNGADDTGYTLAFDAAAGSVTAEFFETSGIFTVRALVKSGSSWYISDTSQIGDGTLSLNGATDTWYPYAPDTNMHINAGTLTGGVLGSTLTNIQALGLVGQVDAAAGKDANKPRIQVTAMSASMVQTAVVLAVEFGGDYNDGNTAGSWSPALVYENGDFDGEADADDRRGYNPMDATIPGYNDVTPLGTNLKFNIGNQVTYFDLTSADPLRGFFRWAGLSTTVDSYQFGSGATNDGVGQIATFVPNLSKADFLNGYDDPSYALSFSDADSIVIDTIKQTGEVQTVHAIVQNGSDWYISATSEVGTSVLTINGFTETWHPYTPGTNMLIPVLTGGVLGSTLTDIQAVGMVGQVTEPAGQSGSIFRFQGLTVRMDQTLTPLEPTLREFDTPVVTVTPTIDGIKTLGEWGDAFELPMQWPALGQLPNIGSVSLGVLPETEADLDDISAVFFFKWDATNLYILAEVTDDVLIPALAAGSAAWPDDHFILGIDPDLTDGDADVNIFLAEFFIDSLGDPRHYFRSDLVPGIVDPALNVFTNHEVEGSEVAGGYVIELALNWADLGVTSPVATDMIGVSILLFDNDIDDAAIDVFLNSTGGSIVLPSEYHQVTLTGLKNSFANYIGQYDVGILDQPSDDPDSDEVDNFTEYALGGDPTVSDAPSIQPVGELATQGEDDVFAFTYNRRIGATALGLTYEVTGKTDLTGPTWSTTGIDAEAEVTTLDDEFEAVTATTPIDVDNKFLHLEITD